MGSKKKVIGYIVYNKGKTEYFCPLHGAGFDPDIRTKIAAGDKLNTFKEKICCQSKGCETEIEPTEKIVGLAVIGKVEQEQTAGEVEQKETTGEDENEPSDDEIEPSDDLEMVAIETFAHKDWGKLIQYLAKCRGVVTWPIRGVPKITPTAGAPPLKIGPISPDIVVTTDPSGKLEESDLAKLGCLFNPEMQARIRYFKKIPEMLAFLQENDGSLRLEPQAHTGRLYLTISLKGKPDQTSAA